ncbi:Ribonuclease VapC32 (plasmid) [Cupriavidus taiwanensis]|uniref:Ribonuclease VapC32 n=1 Tax=Cupriavidus taiwanensis TaxID=164546 RepID=A0A375IJZ3_9BURK|nr:PIN domain-containing protein [Cupriavidus taiwanensis]SOY61527.1 putative toxin of a toxin/antitoxin system, PIN domain [Cupriavidus taiwanensis]SOY62584.1 putative toxin of a toxin/antitoxin system, PIN domain [Cupriavidus taiwanensis]SOY98021.1 putative toxin of a toxin/antitoxin system, PIN domain [Cupriavidus taiwanensis]SOZ68342.1 putative toxin of a toxin/antitoxin system, PIN domain [Cupriavidus taiwanensis]SOZ84941.1 putative toxin of a toxin/antitoxin system, PIN domain [Cupriavid
MNVLVDTSVWVGHFRQRNDALIRLMEADQVLTHPLVVAELACGTPPSPRAQTLGDIGLLQAARQATLGEVIALVEREQLYGLGCGLVDVTLLASTLITPGARLWTLDQRLSALSVRFGVGYRPRLH